MGAAAVGLLAVLLVVLPAYAQAAHPAMAPAAQTAPSPASDLQKIAGSIDTAIAAADAGDVATARAQFKAFDAAWDDLEDAIRPMARQSYHAIEKAMGGVVAALPNDQASAAAGATALRNLKSVIAREVPVIAAAHPVTTRVYFIAADEVDWDYVPSGQNKITGEGWDEDARTFVQGGEGRIGRVYRKAVYHAYTDATFSKRAPVDAAWQHLGILGPVLHAEVGDAIQVHFRNNTSFPTSIHAHGARYAKDSEGAPYADGVSESDKEGSSVDPGESYTYTWDVPERAGPGPMDGSSIVWMYHSHVDEVSDTNAGLVGPLIVTRHGSAREDGSPKDVDRELVTLFSIFNENESPYLKDNIRRFVGDPQTVDTRSNEFKESNLKHAINGFLYGNLSGLTMKAGERVRWYVLDLGSETDLHTPHWHGQTGLLNGMRTDMAELLPGSMKVLDMVTDEPGTWLFHCHVNDHIRAGMQALFTVRP